MIVFETDSRQALISGIAAIAGLVVASLIAVVLAILLPKTLITHMLITLVLAMLLGVAWLSYHLWALTRVSYAIDRNSFVIRWGPYREIIPMGDVQRVIAASDIAADLRLLRVPLPNWWIGSGTHPALGRIHFFANTPLDQQIIVITPEASYAISPFDREGFIEAFRARFDMGPTQPVQHVRLLPTIVTWPLWRDRVAFLLVLVAIGLNSLLFALSFARYPVLPDQVVLHFDAAGVADRMGPKAQAFGPALIALQLFLVNFLIGLLIYWRGERLAAYLAWGGSAAVQLLFLVATLTVAFTL
jgi:hypothetical protein